MHKGLPFLMLALLLGSCGGADDGEKPAPLEQSAAPAPIATAPTPEAVSQIVPWGTETDPPFHLASGHVLRSSEDGSSRLPGWRSGGRRPWGDGPDDCCVLLFWRGEQGEELLFALTKPLSHSAQGIIETEEVITTYTVRLARSEAISGDCRVNQRRAVLGIWNVERKGLRAVLADGQQFNIHRQPYFNDERDVDVECSFDSALSTHNTVEPPQGSAAEGGQADSENGAAQQGALNQVPQQSVAEE